MGQLIFLETDFTFNGKGDGTSWSDALNWDKNLIPNHSTFAHVIIPSGFDVILNDAVDIEVLTLRIAENGSLDVNSGLFVNTSEATPDRDSIGLINLGTINVNNRLEVGGSVLGIKNEGEIFISENSILDVSGLFILGDSFNPFINEGIVNNGLISTNGVISFICGCPSFDFPEVGLTGVAIKNFGTFTILEKGGIIIFKRLAKGLINFESGTFENDGFIDINILKFKDFQVSEPIHGIENMGSFHNKLNSRIAYTLVRGEGILNTTTGTFVNDGLIFSDPLKPSPSQDEEPTIEELQLGRGPENFIVNNNKFTNNGKIFTGPRIFGLNDDIFIINRDTFINTDSLFTTSNAGGKLMNELGSVFLNSGMIKLPQSVLVDRISIAVLNEDTIIGLEIPGLSPRISNKGTFTNLADGKVDLGERGRFQNQGVLDNENGASISTDFMDNQSEFNNAGMLKIGKLFENTEMFTNTSFAELIFTEANDSIVVDDGPFFDLESGAVNDSLMTDAFFINKGTVNNSGEIKTDITDNHAGGVENGIQNNGQFNNLAQGLIELKGLGLIGNGIANMPDTGFPHPVFHNQGTIIIGDANNNLTKNGILNQDTFKNSFLATINIDNTEKDGIFNDVNGIFNNLHGTINIGVNKEITKNGIQNEGIFKNEGDGLNGKLDIHSVFGNAINNTIGTFINLSNIEIGNDLGFIGSPAIDNSGNFINELEGVLNIFNAGQEVGGLVTALNNINTVQNKGKLIINPFEFDDIGIFNLGDFTNENCGLIVLSSKIENFAEQTFINNGFIESELHGSLHINDGNFTNKGILEDHFDSFKDVNITNNGYIVAPYQTNDNTDLLSDILQFTQVEGNFNIGTAWDNISGGSNGTYLPASNELDLVNFLAEGSNNEFHFGIENDGGKCTQEMTLLITVEEAPFIDCTTTKTNETESLKNGTLSVEIQGNFPTFSIAWTGPNGFLDSLANIDSLVAGIYSVTVTDSVGTATTCVDTLLNVVDINCTLDISPAFNGEPTGVINLEFDGGLGPFNFAWDGPGGFVSDSKNISELALGNYEVTVADVNATEAICFGTIEDIVPPFCDTTTIKWTGGAQRHPSGLKDTLIGDGISWTDVNNWDLQRVPNSNDVVEINTNSALVNLFGRDTITIDVPDGTKLKKLSNLLVVPVGLNNNLLRIMGQLEITCGLSGRFIFVPNTKLIGTDALVEIRVSGKTLLGEIDLVGPGTDADILIFRNQVINNGTIKVSNHFKGKGTLLTTHNPGGFINNETVLLEKGGIGLKNISGVDSVKVNNGTIEVADCTTGIMDWGENKGTIELRGCNLGMSFLDGFNDDAAVVRADDCNTGIELKAQFFADLLFVNFGDIEIGFTDFCAKGMLEGGENTGNIEMKKVGIGMDIDKRFTNSGMLNIGVPNNNNPLEGIITRSGGGGLVENFGDIAMIGVNGFGVEPKCENKSTGTLTITGNVNNQNGVGVHNLVSNSGVISATNLGLGVRIINSNDSLIQVKNCQIGVQGQNTTNSTINNGKLIVDACLLNGIFIDGSFNLSSKPLTNNGTIEIGFAETCGVGINGPVFNNNTIKMLKVETGIMLTNGVNNLFENNSILEIGIEGNPLSVVGTGIDVNRANFSNKGFLKIFGFDKKGIRQFNSDRFASAPFLFHNEPSGEVKIFGKLNTNLAPIPDVGIENLSAVFKNEGNIEIKDIRTTGIRNNAIQNLTNYTSEFINDSLITINFIGVNVNSPGAQGIANLGFGKFVNNAEIRIGSEDGNNTMGGKIKGVGLLTQGFISRDKPHFINNGILKVDRVINGGSPNFETGHGLLMHLNFRAAFAPSFENNGSLFIGQRSTIAKDGIKMHKDVSTSITSSFLNKGSININRIGRDGINVNICDKTADFDNEGNIVIGDQIGSGRNGVRIKNADFNNSPTGSLTINATVGNGMELLEDDGFSPTLTNEGIIKIGNAAKIGGFGISLNSSNGEITNKENANISIDRCGNDAFNIEETSTFGISFFRNSGSIEIGKLTPENTPIQGNGISLKRTYAFNNAVGGAPLPSIIIENCTGNGLDMVEEFLFNNPGIITIQNVNGHGIRMADEQADFEFDPTDFENDGTITITDIGGHGLFIEKETDFLNKPNAILNIVTTLRDGIQLEGNPNSSLINESLIIIDDIGKNGITVGDSSTVGNRDELTIIAALDIGIKNEGFFTNDSTANTLLIQECDIAILNKREFINEGNAQILVDGDYKLGIQNEGQSTKFRNEGKIELENTPAKGTDLCLKNMDNALFENAACATVNFFGNFENATGAEIKNEGFFMLNVVDTPITFINNSSFINDGAVMDVQERLDFANITNNELFLRATCKGDPSTGLINEVLQFGGNGHFSVANTWTVNGQGFANSTYEATFNQVTFPETRPDSNFIASFLVTDNVNNCNLDMSIGLSFTPNDAGINTNAGEDQLNVCDTMVILAANTPSPNTVGTWTFVDNGDGLGIIENSNNPTSRFKGTLGQSYTLRWSLMATCGNGEDDVVIHFDVDEDGDGFWLNDGDCEDTDATIFPNAPELCDGKDNNCDGIIPPEEVDNDMDGFFACFDCNDNNAAIFPFADEVCDGIDNNCNGLVDELDCESECSDQDLVIDDDPIPGGVFATSKTINSAGRVDNDSTIDFKAVLFITLNPGFHAEAGSNFTAKIEACAAILIASETSTARAGNSNSETPSPSLINTLNKDLELSNLKVFPNPVQDQTTLEITLTKATNIYLDLYNLNGQKISSLVNGESLPKGVHNYQWQCEQVGAGIYLLVMNGRNVGKLVVIR